ncbi:MAG: chloride channel protein [Sneathiella sp.]|nr:chloride channel protein [Sneathiella sp.]
MSLPGFNLKSNKIWTSAGALKNNLSVKLLLCSLVIGLLAGYGALGFRLLIAKTQLLAYGFEDELVVTGAANIPWWQIMLIPIAGGLIIGLFLKYVVPENRVQGVADVIEAAVVRKGKMKLWPGITSFIASGVSLGTGASGGREGPVVHFAAMLGSQVGQRLRLPSRYYPTLIACGVASGVAASFNAPIAGMFFALEVVLGSMASRAVAPIVLSSVVGTVVSRVHVGDYPAFIIPNYNIVTWWELPAIAILGIVSAVVALLFIWSIGFSERLIDRFKIPDVLRPAAGGCALGIIALGFPQIIGVGYEATDMALKEEYGLLLLLSLIVVKTMAVGITAGSRFGGGFFSPSLFVGAMTGGAFGIIAAWVFPDMAASHGLYAIVGMTAVASSVLGAPISTILIVFELTGDYKISIAVMVAVAATTIITKQVLDRSIFQVQLARRNVDIKESKAMRFLKYRQVRGIMDRDFTEIPSETTMTELRHIVSQHNHDKFVVIDPESKKFLGRLDYGDLRPHLFGNTDEDPALAGHLVQSHCPVIFPDSSLKSAMSIMKKDEVECLPVIDTATETRLVGLLHYKDLLREYNDALLKLEKDDDEDQK